MKKERTMLDEKIKVKLGDLKQTIHLKSKDEKNPVLLFLHGGPGVTNRHSVMTANDDLLDDFTIVAWDQRGTGGSYFGCKADSLTIDRLTTDAKELVDYLCERFGKSKIFAIGGSWGSLLGTNLIKCYPEKIAAFIGFGQFVDGARNEDLSYNYTLEEARKAGDEESVRKLEELGAPIAGIYTGGFKGMMTERNIMMKYGGYSKHAGKQSYLDAMIKPILKSHEYSLPELYGYVKGYKFVLTKMWPEVAAVNFNETHTKFTVPFYILDGRQDKNTPSELVEEWFEKIKAPEKELIWFDESGHNPLFDEPEKFKSILKEKFLSIAKNL